jgi:hypothetical protein
VPHAQIARLTGLYTRSPTGVFVSSRRDHALSTTGAEPGVTATSVTAPAVDLALSDRAFGSFRRGRVNAGEIHDCRRGNQTAADQQHKPAGICSHHAWYCANTHFPERSQMARTAASIVS